MTLTTIFRCREARVLDALVRLNGKKVTVEKIAAEADRSATLVHRVMPKLIREGLVRKEREANRVVYWLNGDNPRAAALAQVSVAGRR